MPAETPDTNDAISATLRDAYPDRPLPTGLEERLTRRLASQVARPMPRRVALTLATGTLGIAAFMGISALMPKPAFGLKKVQDAFARVRTMHRVEYAGAMKTGEQWYDGKQFRVDSLLKDKLVWRQVIRGKDTFTYYPDKKHLELGNFVGELPTPVASLSRIFRQLEKSGQGRAIENQGIQNIAGRRAEVYKISLPKAHYFLGFGSRSEKNITLFVDPATNLPFRIEERQTEGERWTVRTSEIAFNEAIPQKVFVTEFPGAARKDKQAATYERWREHILNPVFAQKTSTGVTIRLFEVVEALGLVAWFTTDGNAPTTISLSGKGHDCPVLAQGTVGESDPKLAARYTIDGKRLQWAVFQQTFVAPMGNGDWRLTVGTGGKTVTFSPHVGILGDGPLPQCEPSAEIRKLHPKLAGERCRDRGEYFLDDRWKADYPLVTEAVMGQLDPHEEALRWFQRAVNEDGPSLPHAIDWRRMADCYEALDQPAKVIEYRHKADQEDRENKP
ncbi:MAG: hypothetical protein QM758_19480 [Armatimonas sp.]